MELHEKTFSSGGGAGEGEFCEVEASQLLIKSWPDRGRPLIIRYINSRERAQASIRAPEPGMRIRLVPSRGAAPRVRLLTAQPEEELLSIAHCAIWSLVDPEDLHEQPKQEVQGVSLTAGVSVVVPSAAETSLGVFTAWRSGVLRTAGTVSTDPNTLRFRLYAVCGAQERQVGDSLAIPHKKDHFEYSLRDTATGALSSRFLPVVHAGRQYKLTVEHAVGVAVSYDADVYIEPVELF